MKPIVCGHHRAAILSQATLLMVETVDLHPCIHPCNIETEQLLLLRSPPCRVQHTRASLEINNSMWHVLRLFNMSTITREWIAVQHSHLLPFHDILLAGKPRSAPATKHMGIPPGMKETIETECNPSQVRIWGGTQSKCRASGVLPAHPVLLGRAVLGRLSNTHWPGAVSINLSNMMQLLIKMLFFFHQMRDGQQNARGTPASAQYSIIA